MFPVDHPSFPRCIGRHEKVPCDGKRGKHPVVAWGTGATTDPQAVGRRFAGLARNIGIATGPSGLLVVDEDAPGELERLARAHGQRVPETYTVATGRHEGGRHFYFAAPAGVRVGNANALVKAGYKLDVRGDGGFVVAAGSLHETGTVYTASGGDPAPAPGWLVELLTPATPTPAGGSVLDLLDRHAGPIPEQTRHSTLLSYAGRLRNRRLTLAEAEVLFERRWKDCAQPPAAGSPYTWEEGLALLHDVWERYAAGSAPEGETPQDRHQQLVAAEVEKLRARTEATEIVRREQLQPGAVPELVDLPGFLAVPDEPLEYRVEGLWPSGGRVLLSAPHKVGKSTLLANLLTALVDGGRFLDAFTVTPPAGQIVLVDVELDARMLRRWLRAQGVLAADRVDVLSLRGRAASFDLTDPTVRAGWAAKFRERQASVVLVDCIRPLLDAVGLSEDKDGGRWTSGFDALLAESGAEEGLAVHHTGHNAARPRGDSRFGDWADARWDLRLDGDRDERGANEGPRYFSAYGRDVAVDEALLSYEPAARRLRLVGGNRRDHAADAAVPSVLEVLESSPGASGRAIEAALEGRHKRQEVREALRLAVAEGLVTTTPGPRGATLHTLHRASAPSAPTVRQRTGDECASAPLGRTAHTHATGEQNTGALDTGALDDDERLGIDLLTRELGAEFVELRRAGGQR